MDTALFMTYLRDHDGVAPSDAARELGVSTRTLRKYTARANEALEGVANVEVGRTSGYHLNILDAEQFEAWLVAHDTTTSSLWNKTSTERVNYLINDLLMRTDWIKLQDLSEALYVSKSALSGDLKKVEERLRPYDLTLEKRSHYGIRVVGSEMSRRLCLAHAAVEASEALSTPMSVSPGRMKAVAAFGPIQASLSAARRALLQKRLGGGQLQNEAELLEAIATCVTSVSEEQGLTINAAAFQNLLVHIMVALLRIAEDCYVPMEDASLQRIQETKAYRAAEEIARRIADLVPIELPREEIAYIAIHLAGKQTMFHSPADDNLVISDEVWDVVSCMLERVWKVFRFDFRNDLELRMNLARHIVPLAVRLRYNLKLKNPMLTEIKARYPLSFSIAVDASSVIAEKYDSSLSNDEIGYIALAFELALERSKTEAVKKNILVVCASGAGSARLLEYQCRREFGDYIDEVRTCDVLGLGKVDFTNIDYVFTTVPLDRELPVPVRQVACFLDSVEAERARELLRRDAKAFDDPCRFVDPQLFFPHLTAKTADEVLDYLISKVEQVKGVEPRFRELVLSREGKMPTAFGNGIAMPHPLEVATDETFICVGLLDEPIAWGESGEQVQAVFLSAFAFRENDGSRAFLDHFAGLLMDPQAVAQLAANQTWDTFAHLLRTSFAADATTVPRPSERRS